MRYDEILMAIEYLNTRRDLAGYENAVTNFFEEYQDDLRRAVEAWKLVEENELVVERDTSGQWCTTEWKTDGVSWGPDPISAVLDAKGADHAK